MAIFVVLFARWGWHHMMSSRLCAVVLAQLLLRQLLCWGNDVLQHCTSLHSSTSLLLKNQQLRCAPHEHSPSCCVAPCGLTQGVGCSTSTCADGTLHVRHHGKLCR